MFQPVLSSLISTAHATDLAVVAPAPSFGPAGVLVFFVLIAVALFFVEKKNPGTAAKIAATVRGWFARK